MWSCLNTVDMPPKTLFLLSQHHTRQSSLLDWHLHQHLDQHNISVCDQTAISFHDERQHIFAAVDAVNLNHRVTCDVIGLIILSIHKYRQLRLEICIHSYCSCIDAIETAGRGFLCYS
uniref:Uncharacterized protein n=2 Tax=Physcomitrium patens TaxID=3218 RepID=A0A2K1ICB7_PHYPA|nr:hypothetical protein PHYPA_030411 [Physcomitrium patens]